MQCYPLWNGNEQWIIIIIIIIIIIDSVMAIIKLKNVHE